MRDTSGTHNQPHYAENGVPADAADLTEVADFAATVGNRKVGTSQAMNALAGADVWEGLEYWATDLSQIYRYLSGGWVAAGRWTSGTFLGTVNSDGTTAIAHNLNGTPNVQITSQSHPTTDVNSFTFLPILFGSATASNFHVRCIDLRLPGWSTTNQSIRFTWTAFLNS